MKNFLLIFVLILFTSCSYDRDKKLIEHLKTHPEDFVNIINQCNKDGELLMNISKFVRYDKLGDETKNALEKINIEKIEYVILGTPDCEEKNQRHIEIFFGNDEHIEYTACEDLIHEPGQNSYLEETYIDIYYLNRNWSLWIKN